MAFGDDVIKTFPFGGDHGNTGGIGVDDAARNALGIKVCGKQQCKIILQDRGGLVKRDAAAVAESRWPPPIVNAPLPSSPVVTDAFSA